MTDTPYDLLLGQVRETALLNGTSAVLSWDQEVMMPRAGAEYRARQLALLARLAHDRTVDVRMGAWLSACEADPKLAANAHAAANLRELRRGHDRAARLPGALVAELAETESLAQIAWADARQASDFDRFRPWLEKLVTLHRRKAECLDSASGEPWDALADDFEPGMTAASIQQLFAPLRQALGELVDELRGKGEAPGGAIHRVPLPVIVQEAFVRAVAAQMGFDRERGRIDRSTHPFCGGSHCDDVRITTRFAEDNVLDALGSTMHEAGHGLYEQGLSREHVGTPLGEAVSLGVHESQSRLWENHVGRSRAFWQWCHGIASEHLGAAVGGFSADAWYRDANQVQPDFIRVEADEATYDLHVMVRFELELALLRGELAVADLPAAWNDKYRDYLSLQVPDDRRGCLQDVHWSCGLFGYFPTYTLGNLYAAQFFAAARAALPDLDADLGRGEFAPLRQWLADNIHQHGQRWRAAELCERVTGAPLSSQPFLDYLRGKLREVYKI